MAEWTDDDAAQAKAEGWGIFECSGSEDGPWQLQKFDDPGQHSGAPSPYPFTADADVWAHVRTGETPLLRKALAFLAIHNPPEYHRVTTGNR